MEALAKAGLLPQTPLGTADQRRLIQVANQIIAKAERMPLSAIASALGADRLWFLSQLKRICESPEGHVSIKGLQLLAQIHGLWDKQTRTHHVELVMHPAEQPPPHVQRPAVTLSNGQCRPLHEPSGDARARRRGVPHRFGLHQDDGVGGSGAAEPSPWMLNCQRRRRVWRPFHGIVLCSHRKYRPLWPA